MTIRIRSARRLLRRDCLPAHRSSSGLAAAHGSWAGRGCRGRAANQRDRVRQSDLYPRHVHRGGEKILPAIQPAPDTHASCAAIRHRTGAAPHRPPGLCFAWVAFTYPFNLTGQPAATVPCGFTRVGLPIGLQIVGWPLEAATVPRTAAATAPGLSRVTDSSILSLQVEKNSCFVKLRGQFESD
ncbi:MAG: amidase family protein [Candidatus Methylomirabilales bacterium]